MSKYCTNCGTTLADDDLFCWSCGKKQEIVNTSFECKFEDDTKSQTEEQIIEPLSLDVYKSVDESTTGSTQSPIAETFGKKRKNSKILIGIICAVSAILIITYISSRIITDNKFNLPDLFKFETLMTNAVIDFFEQQGIDATAEGYLLKEYEISDMSGTEADYEHMIYCTYGPNIFLTGTANNNKVEYVFTFVPLVGIDVDTDVIASFAPTVMITAGLFNDKYSDYESLYDLIKEMAQSGTPNEQDDSRTLVIDDVEYTLIVSDVMLGFTINARSAERSSEVLSIQRKTTISSVDDYAIYKSKINEYRQALTMGMDAFKAKYNDGWHLSSINALRVYDLYNYGGSAEYTFFDIDGNGTSELIFSRSFSSIIDIYTIHNGKLIKLFDNCDFGDRSRIHVLSEGRLLSEGSSGASSGSCEMYKIDAERGKISSPISAYYFDGFGPNPYMTEYTYVTEDEFYDIVSEWMDESLFEEFEWTMIAEIPEPEWDWSDDEVYYFD